VVGSDTPAYATRPMWRRVFFHNETMRQNGRPDGLAVEVVIG